MTVGAEARGGHRISCSINSLPYSFETGSLTKPGAGLVDSKPSYLPVPAPTVMKDVEDSNPFPHACTANAFTR